jgi:hypothetical protein
MAEEEWPERALSVLDSVWAQKEKMSRIRALMSDYLGRVPTADEVRAKVNRFVEVLPVKATPIVRETAAPKVEPMVEEASPVQSAPTTVEFPAVVDLRLTMAPKPRPDPVRLVPSGTFRASGFSMIGGRVR